MSKEESKKFKLKMGLVYFFILFLGVMCLIKILHLVIFEKKLYSGTAAECIDMTGENAKKYKKDSCYCYITENNVTPLRGEIFDDKGEVLVSNSIVFDITVDGRVFTKEDTLYRKDKEKLDGLVNDLSSLFYAQFKDRFKNKDRAYYQKMFTRALKEGKNSLILQSSLTNEKQWITSDDTALIAKMPLLGMKKYYSGLNYTSRVVRILPFGTMARKTLGIYGKDARYGIENAYNEELQGVAGNKKYLYVNKARIPLSGVTDPVDGDDVHTTINSDIQNLAQNELQKMLVAQKAEWGCVVVMETKTGMVKAISNLTRNRRDSLAYYEGKNYALTEMVEPGSTFKLASLLAYLERKKKDTEKKYPILAHTFDYKGRKYPKKDRDDVYEASAYPIEAFQRSSNVGIASMIFDTYPTYSDYLKKLDSMSITALLDMKIERTPQPNIKRRASDFNTFYNATHGVAFKMTPIQTLAYFNAVANGGKMVLPFFIRYVSRNSEIIESYNTEVISNQICSKETIGRAKKYLESVVTGEFGTARNYKDRFSFAGKTGTRDIWNEEIKAYTKTRNSVSFCGYFPAEDPQYTCIVFIYNVPKKSSIAIDVFTRIGMGVMSMQNQAGKQMVDTKQPRKFPKVHPVSIDDLEVILSNFGFTSFSRSKGITSHYVYSGMNDKGEPIAKPYAIPVKNRVPDVTGMLPSDAIYELNKAGFRVKIQGRGVVQGQSYNNSVVTLKLVPPGGELKLNKENNPVRDGVTATQNSRPPPR